MESGLLEVGTRKQTENDEKQAGCRLAVVRREAPAVLMWPYRRRELQWGCCGGRGCRRGCRGHRGCRGTYLVGVAADGGPRRKGWKLLGLILLI